MNEINTLMERNVACMDEGMDHHEVRACLDSVKCPDGRVEYRVEIDYRDVLITTCYDTALGVFHSLDLDDALQNKMAIAKTRPYTPE